MQFQEKFGAVLQEIYLLKPCVFDSLAARQEGQIRTRFYKANICIYFDKFPRNIRILLRKFVLPILNICSSKTQRPSSLNFKMILMLAECRQVRTLQARQVPKALKIQASGRVRICPSCLQASLTRSWGDRRTPACFAREGEPDPMLHHEKRPPFGGLFSWWSIGDSNP